MTRLTFPSRSVVRPALAVSSLAGLLVLPLAFPRSADAQSDPSTLAVPAAHTDAVASAVTEASRRFGVPEHWIRSVMRVESAGNARAISHAGAMGLMQVMPATYAELRRRYGLGADPFAIRDNVLAGTAYLREMYDRYGAPGFLGAYNAGPDRWEKHLSGARRLPGETVRYLGRLGRMLGLGRPPAAGTAQTVFVPPPLPVPIFVSIIGPASPDLGLLGSDQTRQTTSSSNAIPASGLALFVSRKGASGMPLTMPSIGQAASGLDGPSGPIRARARSTEPSSNPLFPPR